MTGGLKGHLSREEVARREKARKVCDYIGHLSPEMRQIVGRRFEAEFSDLGLTVDGAYSGYYLSRLFPDML